MASFHPRNQVDLQPLLPLESIRDWRGCVEEVPPLASGEIRTLGLTLHPEVAKLFLKKTEEWKKKKYRQIILPNKTCQLMKENYSINKPKSIIEISLRQHPDMKDIISDRNKMLPEDLRVEHFAEPFTLSSDDMRRMPPGAQGMRLRNDLKNSLPPGTVLGAYRSYMIMDEDRIFNLNHFGDPGCVDRNPGFKRTRMQMKNLLEMYCVNTIEISKGNTMINLYCDALGYGNSSALLNDPVIDPLSILRNQLVYDDWYNDAERIPGIPGNVAQVHVVEVEVRGWVYPIVVMASEGKPGQELTYMYGAGYWNMMLELEMNDEPSHGPLAPRFFGSSVHGSSASCSCPSSIIGCMGGAAEQNELLADEARPVHGKKPAGPCVANPVPVQGTKRPRELGMVDVIVEPGPSSRHKMNAGANARPEVEAGPSQRPFAPTLYDQAGRILTQERMAPVLAPIHRLFVDRLGTLIPFISRETTTQMVDAMAEMFGMSLAAYLQQMGLSGPVS